MKQRLAQHLRPRLTLGQKIKSDVLCECRSDVFNSSRHHGLYSPWNSPGQNTEVDSHFLLQHFVGYRCRKCLPGQRAYKQCLGRCYFDNKSVFSGEILQEKLYSNFLGRWIYEFSLSVYVSEQWCITGGSILQCHHQQDPRLVNESGREEEYLTNAAIQGKLSSMEPEDRQGLRDSAHGEDKVCSGQHAEEEVHGFMEAVLGEDNEDEQPVPKQGSGIGNNKGDGNPHVVVFKARDAQQAEDCVATTSVV